MEKPIIVELKEKQEFDKLRKKVNQELPDLSIRVFALRNKIYSGCGFHYDLEARLGKLIHGTNQHNDIEVYDIVNIIGYGVNYKMFIESLVEAEKSAKKFLKKNS